MDLVRRNKYQNRGSAVVPKLSVKVRDRSGIGAFQLLEIDKWRALRA